MSHADRALLEKFTDLLRITHSIKKSEVALALGLSKTQLLKKLIEWGKTLTFKIKDEFIIVEDLDGFLGSLDEQFATWESQEHAKTGKNEALEAEPTSHPKSTGALTINTKLNVNFQSFAKQESPTKPVAKLAPAISDSMDYHGTPLVTNEWKAMMELEQLLDGKTIPAKPDVKYDNFGFSTERGHVIKLSLYRQGLVSLPETIGNLTSLKELYLENNQLSSFPETMSSLKSLQRLWFGNNQISSFPEVINKWITGLVEEGCSVDPFQGSATSRSKRNRRQPIK